MADSPLLPPPPLPPPMLPPPRPCPCLRRHHCFSLRQRHRPSDAPVDGWLFCHLSPLACCVVCRPNLSAPAVVRCVINAFSAGPPSPFADHRQPLSYRSFTEHQLPLPLSLKVGCCVFRLPSSIPTTSPSRKRFQFPLLGLILTYLEQVCALFFERLKNLRGCKIGGKHFRFSYLRML